MASELRVNTLKDASGNNSVGMSYVANGSAKAWVNFDGTGTIAARDSLNVSSLTDNAAGDYSVNFSTSLNNANYGRLATMNRDGLATNDWGSQSYTASTSLIKIITWSNATTTDCPDISAAIHGDLA